VSNLAEEIIDDVTVLHLSGSLTQDNIPLIESRLRLLTAHNSPRIVIDVNEVDAVTTPAITMFLTALRAAEATGGRVVFANVSGITGDIFTRCRLDVIFTMSGSVEEAVKLAREGAS
jgi:anti-anti-sigma factor